MIDLEWQWRKAAECYHEARPTLVRLVQEVFDREGSGGTLEVVRDYCLVQGIPPFSCRHLGIEVTRWMDWRAGMLAFDDGFGTHGFGTHLTL